MIHTGHKFSLLTIEAGWYDFDMPLMLAEGVSVVTTLPAAMDAHWRRWLGDFVSEEITKANLYVLAVKPSDNPEQLNYDTQDLVDSVRRVLGALLIVGVPLTGQVHLVNGDSASGEPHIRQFQPMPNPATTEGSLPYHFQQSDADRVRTVYDVLTAIWSRKGEFARLKRGIHAYLKAVHEPEGEYRLTQLVQALEALIIPTIGRTAKQFVHRCQFLAGACDVNKDVLTEVYLIRSHVEHLNTWQDVFPGRPLEECTETATRRIRQIEALARHAYRRLLLDRTLLDTFRTDESIRRLWDDELGQQKEKDRYRRAFWGKGINLTEIE